MRLEIPQLNTSIAAVREFMEQARNAPTLGESAYFTKLARRASKKGA
jgi:hypothetical protein